MSDYRLVIKPSARRHLRSLPMEISSRITAKIMALASDPRPVGCLKLQGTKNDWRIRVGDYRVIYSIDEDIAALSISGKCVIDGKFMIRRKAREGERSRFIF